MRDDQRDTDGPAGPAPRSRGRPDGRPGKGELAKGEPGKPRGELDDETRRRLGRALRAHYADLLSAPVPERFAALIAGLDAGPRRAKVAPPAGPSDDSSGDLPGREDTR
jgi:hypothetical protein